jgi:hypothetical protein
MQTKVFIEVSRGRNVFRDVRQVHNAMMCNVTYIFVYFACNIWEQSIVSSTSLTLQSLKFIWVVLKN